MKTKNNQTIPYPRLTIRRKILGIIGKTLLAILTRPQVEGIENIPKEGPVILAGNHVSTLEPVFMFLHSKPPVEPMGAGDMPFEGVIDHIVNFYGYIPVNRGKLDRNAMNQALSVLNQKGFLGIYPEGGTWDPGNMPAQIGVAWLSHKAQARVVPIAFSGFRGSWGKIFKLKRPKLGMTVGKVIPPLNAENDPRPIKEIYQEYADTVLERIHELVDPADMLAVPCKSEFDLLALSTHGETIPLPGNDVVAQFFHNPVLLDSLFINLKRPIKVLYPGEQKRSRSEFIRALESIPEVLEENAGFFTYRLGMERGMQLQEALQNLKRFLEALPAGEGLVLRANARYQYRDGRVETISSDYDLSAA